MKLTILSLLKFLQIEHLPLLDNILNGPLTPGSTYQFLQRGRDVNFVVIETGEWTEGLSTLKRVENVDTSSVGLIFGIVVAIILVIVIVSAVFLYLKRRKVEESKPFVGKYSML
jgi:hypothetical protein